MGGKKPRGGAKARARARKRALGNDPFERGAAEREPIARASPATPSPATPSPSTPSPSTPTPTPGVLEGAAARIASVERRLDSALEGVEAKLQDLATRGGLPGAPGELREALARLLPAVKGRLASALDLLRLLQPPERLDRFGMDVRFVERLDPLVDLLHSAWWRVVVREVARVPADGPAIVVANHAGTVPWDAFVLRHALRREHPAHRELRPLLDDAECDLPVFGPALVRYGAVRASPDAANAILAAGGLVGVFPEGSAVARKPWRDRYRIQRFGRGGFVKVALRARAPIVPCAIVGSEEASPAISRTGWLAERLGIPLVPGTSALRLGSAALLPLPSRWTLRFGEPVEVSGHAPEAAEDPAVVAALTERVRSTLQAMLDEDVAGRASVFL